MVHSHLLCKQWEIAYGNRYKGVILSSSFFQFIYELDYQSDKSRLYAISNPVLKLQLMFTFVKMNVKTCA